MVIRAMSSDGKPPGWALVIGGSRGLGAECALALAARGYAIALSYKANDAAARAVCDGALAAGAAFARSFAVDLSDPDSCAAAVDATIAELGPPRCVVHSAGEVLRASVDDTDVASFAHMLRVNCTSAYAVSRIASRAMRQAGGSITLLSSVIGPFGVRDRVAYAASKSGLIGLSKALAVELAPAVRVNAVMLGTFATDMNTALMRDQAALDTLTARVPLARLGTAEEVGRVVAFLADEAAFVTGAVWEVDGGVTARLATPTGDPLI